MIIELTSEEACILIGIFTIHLKTVPRFTKDYEHIMSIINKIFDEDKNEVEEYLKKRGEGEH